MLQHHFHLISRSHCCGQCWYTPVLTVEVLLYGFFRLRGLGGLLRVLCPRCFCESSSMFWYFSLSKRLKRKFGLFKRCVLHLSTLICANRLPHVNLSAFQIILNICYHSNTIPDCTYQCRINQLMHTKWWQAVALSWNLFFIIYLGHHRILIFFLDSLSNPPPKLKPYINLCVLWV